MTTVANVPEAATVEFRAQNPDTPNQAAHAASFDVKALRRCLGQFATGVTVVTVQNGDRHEGMAANSFSSVSLDPPLVLWSVRKASRRAEVFSTAPHFVINILAEGQIELANRFATFDGDPFATVPWQADDAGVPVLADVLAHLSCDLETTHDGGDHIIIVGRVRSFSVRDGKPLLFAQGRYGALQEYVQLQAPSAVPATSPDEGDCDVGAYQVMRLLRAAQESLSRSFDVHRKSVGLTALEARMLAVLQAEPGTMQQLAARIFTDEVNTQDVIQRMLKAGLVQCDAHGMYSITEAGNAKREQLRARAREFSAQTLKDLGPEKINIAQQFLTDIVERFSK